MTKVKRVMLVIPLAALFAALSISAQAEAPKQSAPKAQPAHTTPNKTIPTPGGPIKNPVDRGSTLKNNPVGASNNCRGCGGAQRPLTEVHVFSNKDRDVRNWGEADRATWRRGIWRHERHDGRWGWWWNVDGGWYFYPQPVYPYPVIVSADVVSDNAAEIPDPTVADAPTGSAPVVTYQASPVVYALPAVPVPQVIFHLPLGISFGH